MTGKTLPIAGNIEVTCAACGKAVTEAHNSADGWTADPCECGSTEFRVKGEVTFPAGTFTGTAAELQPCPFCGTELIHDDNDPEYAHHPWSFDHECPLNSETVRVEAWNKRTPPPPDRPRWFLKETLRERLAALLHEIDDDTTPTAYAAAAAQRAKDES